MSAPTETLRVTYLRGNVVTPTAVLFGGFIEVTGDTITAVCGSDTPIPTAEQKQQELIAAFHSRSSGGGAAAAAAPLPLLVLSTVECPFVVPGFVDIHNHGLGGVDEVCDHWTVPEYSQKELARCGTLSTLASLIFSRARPNAVKECVAALEPRVGKAFPNCCVIEGIHAEGPVIADSGGLPPSSDDIALPQFEQLCASMPSLKIMTISPRLDARVGYERIKHLLKIGVRPSLGHDRRCTEQDVLGALRLIETEGATAAADRPAALPSSSARLAPGVAAAAGGPVPAIGSDNKMHSTHLFNVMGFHHRDPSLVNFGLCRTYPRAAKYRNCSPPTVEVIGDLIHVHPITLQVLFSAREAHDIAIISDCISSAVPGKRLKYNGRTIAVKAEGGCYLCDSTGKPGPTLAGSSVTLADQFCTLIVQFGMDLARACLMLATTPARIAKIDDRVGSIAVGKKASVLVLDAALRRIDRRMIYGRWVEGVEPYTMLRPAVSHL
jgi:N-acetylglucosamine-6-phosphate deacetylase